MDDDADSPAAPRPVRTGTAGSGGEPPLSPSRERYRAIHRIIRTRIALLDYRPGERLSEEAFAAEFGVSRTPLRRVLWRLAAEGLLESRQGVGTFATAFDADELREAYRLRAELVALIDRLDPRPPGPEMPAALAEIRAACGGVADAADPNRAFACVNHRYIGELTGLVGNAALRRTLELLFYRTAPMWAAVVAPQVAVAEAGRLHDEIGEAMRALAAGDVAAVAHLRHWRMSTALARLDSDLATPRKVPPP